MPLAFFCTLFFRHRKKSVSAPWDGKFQFAPESARQAPLRGNCLRQSCCLMLQAGGAFRSPPCTPFGESAYPHRTGVCASGRVGGFPRGKQSAQPALPCVSACCLPELRVANRLRRLYPLDTRFPPFPPRPLRIATRSNRAPHRAASPSPAPESARQSPPRGISYGKAVSCHASRGLSARPLHPLRGVGVSTKQGYAPADTLVAFLGTNNQHAIPHNSGFAPHSKYPLPHPPKPFEKSPTQPFSERSFP